MSLLLRKMSLHFLRTSCVCPTTFSKSAVWWRWVWLFRLCWICLHRSPHNCPLFDTSHEWCIQPAVIQLTPLPSPNPHSFTRDQRAPQGEDPVSSGSLGVCFCLTETGDMRNKSLHLFIWCQPPSAFCPSHFLLYPVPSYRGHLVCVWTSSVTVFPVWATQFGETDKTVGLKEDLYPLHMLSYYWACKCYSTDNISMLVLETLAVWRWQTCNSLFH